VQRLKERIGVQGGARAKVPLKVQRRECKETRERRDTQVCGECKEKRARGERKVVRAKREGLGGECTKWRARMKVQKRKYEEGRETPPDVPLHTRRCSLKNSDCTTPLYLDKSKLLILEVHLYG
jgi:hypothetical protein